MNTEIYDKSRRFYENTIAPMIREKFSEYESHIAVGLAGEGSDCFGYDDSIASWKFINVNVENEMLFDANQALDAMKAFFKKYGNRYCASTKVYSIIEKMRSLVETDEN